MSWHAGRLDPGQAEWAESRLPGIRLVRDMSWNLMESVVLHVRSRDRDVVIKAAGPSNHHVGREISAHPRWTKPLVASGHAARLIDAQVERRILLLEHLPGVLVDQTPAEADADVHAQAGMLLGVLHAQQAKTNAEYEARATARALAWFDGPHRMDAEAASAARRLLEADPAPPVVVVPTHGDWQPRNWLLDGGIVRVIDFGRFAFRPASTDLTRLAAQQWRGRPDLEAAFLAGYGTDPRVPERWRIDRLREAVGTACWAHRVGDEAFEAQGHRMLAEALEMF